MNDERDIRALGPLTRNYFAVVEDDPPAPSFQVPFHEGDFPERRSARMAAVILAICAGFVDAVGFLTLYGLFTAHMTGNTSLLGISIGGGQTADALSRLYPIPIFVGGVVVGAIAFEISRHRKGGAVHWLLLVQISLLVIAVLVGLPFDHGRNLAQNSWGFFIIAALLTMAMGLQTALLRRVGKLPVHTTFITGMLTNVALHAVGLMFATSKKYHTMDKLSPHEHRRWLALGGLVWLGFLSGAALGTVGSEHWHVTALLVPISIYAAAAAWVVAYRPTSIRTG